MTWLRPTGGWFPAVAVLALGLSACTPSPVTFLAALANLVLALVLASRWAVGLMSGSSGPRGPLAWLGCLGLTLAFTPAVISACLGLHAALRSERVPEWGLFSFL